VSPDRPQACRTAPPAVRRGGLDDVGVAAGGGRGGRFGGAGGGVRVGESSVMIVEDW